MSDRCLEKGSRRSLCSFFCCGCGSMNFYVCRSKDSHESQPLANVLVRTTVNKGISAKGLSSHLMAFLAFGSMDASVELMHSKGPTQQSKGC